MNVEYIAIVLTGILLLISILSDKHIINPAAMFFGLWLFILFMDSLHLFGLKTTEDRIYGIIILGIVSFAIGYYFNNIFFYRIKFTIGIHNKAKVYKENYLYEPRYTLIYVLMLLTIVFYAGQFSVTIDYLLSGNTLGTIRRLAQESSGLSYTSGSQFMNAASILIITPFTTILQPLMASDLFFGKKDKKLLFGNLLIILLRTLSDGSRTLLAYLGMSVLICFFFSNARKKIKDRFLKNKKNKKQRQKEKITFVVLFASLLIAVFQVTSSRSGDSLIRYAYYYFSMQPQMLEIWINKVDSASLYGFGMAALNGFAFAIFYITRNTIGVTSTFWRKVYDMLEGTGASWQVITYQGTTANSFVSAFFAFYLDIRSIGVALGMFIYGILTSRIYDRMYKNPNQKNISLYIMWYIGLFYTFVRFQFSNVYYCVAILQLCFIIFRKTKKDRS